MQAKPNAFCGACTVAHVNLNLRCVLCGTTTRQQLGSGLGPADIEETPIELHCGHLAHTTCIEAWCRHTNRRRCPLCDSVHPDLEALKLEWLEGRQPSQPECEARRRVYRCTSPAIIHAAPHANSKLQDSPLVTIFPSNCHSVVGSVVPDTDFLRVWSLHSKGVHRCAELQNIIFYAPMHSNDGAPLFESAEAEPLHIWQRMCMWCICFMSVLTFMVAVLYMWSV